MGKDYFGGLVVCVDCGGECTKPVCCGAVNSSVNCGGKGCTGPEDVEYKTCGGAGALNGDGSPAAAL